MYILALESVRVNYDIVHMPVSRAVIGTDSKSMYIQMAAKKQQQFLLIHKARLIV